MTTVNILVYFLSASVKGSGERILSICDFTQMFRGFSDGSDGKESASNAGDLNLTPGSGRSPRVGILAWRTSWTVHGVAELATTE